MRKKIFTVGFLFLAISSFASDNVLPKSFTDILVKANMTFEMPKGLIETTIIENRQMNYEYALKYPDKRFEVRFAIRPLGKLISDYREKETNKKPGEIFLNPNKLYSSLFKATVLNISGGKMPENMEFDKASVKVDFNADWGATTFVVPGKEFGQDYKYCMVVAIHKDDFGDAYIFFLADSTDKFSELSDPAFYSLKFK